MSFPSPTLPAPALAPWQLSFQGLTFGGIAPGNGYQFQSMVMDMPDVATGDVQRAIDQGEFAGIDVLPGADITIVQALTSDGVSLDHAAQALGGVMGPGGTVETPMWFQTPAGCYCRLVRPRKHNCPVDINRVFAKGIVATSLLHSTDPRWYAAPSQSQTVGIPAFIGGGLAVAPPVPWALGAGSVGGLLTVVNSGLFESRPVLVFTGPCTNPVAANLSIAGTPAIGVTITLNAGDTLTIDTDWHSIVYTTAGSGVGASRRDLLMPGSTWWNLPASSASTIEFTTADTSPVAGTLTVNSASAYLTL
ncbi:MAG: hypothetical protein ACLP50_17635 [Solirubrobacteraceae bacterium]|jgi:hypothetical protein